MLRLKRKGSLIAEGPELKDVWRKARTRDLIELCTVATYDHFTTHHRDGVVIITKCQYRLNGAMIIYEGSPEGWYTHRERHVPVTIFDPNQKERQSLGDWDTYYLHKAGWMIERGEKVLINSKKLLYRGPRDEIWPHERGAIIRRGNKFLLAVYKG